MYILLQYINNNKNFIQRNSVKLHNNYNKYYIDIY